MKFAKRELVGIKARVKSFTNAIHTTDFSTIGNTLNLLNFKTLSQPLKFHFEKIDGFSRKVKSIVFPKSKHSISKPKNYLIY